MRALLGLYSSHYLLSILPIYSISSHSHKHGLSSEQPYRFQPLIIIKISFDTFLEME